jgi:Ser/Thr protein kinase RdoA (MazF antagonist)
MEEGPPLVAKFYRPARWSNAQILEEHAFARELAEREIPVVAPLAIEERTLHAFDGFRFTVYPRRGGRAPELEDAKTLEWIGRFVGRIHAVGAMRTFRERPALDLESHGTEPREWLLASGLVPPDLLEAWKSATALALEAARRCIDRAGDVKVIRLHGDCHAGNILWTDEGPHFVDFDDSRAGPAVQDLWMLLSGDQAAMSRQLHDALAGYEDFCEFDPRELLLVEALRTLRLIHYSAWIARRWNDPAFHGRVSLVRHAPLLARPHTRAAGADRGDGRSTSQYKSLIPELALTVPRGSHPRASDAVCGEGGRNRPSS